MGIIYNEKARTFTLHTHNTTYQMQIDAYGFLLHLYYGRKTDGVMDYLLTYADRGFSGNPQDAGNDRTYSLDVLPQEFPCRLTGDFRSPVLDLVNADGSFGCDLRYQGYEICDGKYELKLNADLSLKICAWDDFDIVVNNVDSIEEYCNKKESEKNYE